MENDAPQSLADSLIELGPLPALALLISLVCTTWLVIGRFRGCFWFREPTPVRDLGFLSAAPVAAILTSIANVASGTVTYMRGGIDVDWVLWQCLNEAASICFMALGCFLFGVLSLMLPTKTHAKAT